MANEEHLKILKQGVEQWNKWRLENAIRPDLSDVDLSDADLTCQPERCRSERCQPEPCRRCI